jgi:DNA-binding PadR family transcriptional regulator
MHQSDRHRHSRRNHQDEIRRELRQNLRHGQANAAFAFRDFFGRGRPGPAIRRGEIRPLILAALQQKPMHGYEVIQELEAESGGRWRPSAGSVYPTLQQLGDEGLVTSEEVDGRRTYTLTDEGRAAAAVASTTRSPWTEPEEEREPDIRQLAVQLAGAVIQVHKMGSPRARGEARRILTDARRQMYRLLAEDVDEAEDVAADDDVAIGEDDTTRV